MPTRTNLLRPVAIFAFLAVFLVSYAEEVTYYVNSKNTVRTEGNALQGVTPEYSQTTASGQAGQITMGNCAYFSLANMPVTIITDIVLTMHSNASSGSGTLSLKQNGMLVTKIEDSDFSAPQWNGEFSSSNVKIRIPLSERLYIRQGDSLSIDICASQNSLYIVSYYIACHAANTEAYTVRLNIGSQGATTEIKETAPNQGVLLPVPDVEYPDYSFVGWTFAQVFPTDSCPQYIPAGSRLYPVSNTLLYALYSDRKAEESRWLQTTDFVSGDYLLASTYENCIAIGGLNKNRKINTLTLDPWLFTEDSLRYMKGSAYPSDAVYHIEFTDDSLAYITNTATNEIIGYSASSSLSLTHNADPWNYRVYDDKQICFYHDYLSSTRYLWATGGATLQDIDSITFAAQSYIYNGYADLLFNIDDAPKDIHSTYTSFPLTDRVENNRFDDVKILPRQILNPYGRPLKLYSSAGLLMLVSNTDMNLQNLSSGMYILLVGTDSRKVFVR